jgi:hypothetical protein
MATLTKRATVYFDPDVHKILRVKAVETDQSISDIVDQALRRELAEDQEDLAAFAKRAKEPSVSYEALLKKLKADGKI